MIVCAIEYQGINSAQLHREIDRLRAVFFLWNMRGSEAWEAQRKACSAPRLDASLVGAKTIILKPYKWEMAFFDGFRVLICPLRGDVGISLLLLLLSSWPTFFLWKVAPCFLGLWV